MPSLFVFRGNDQGVRFELTDEVVTLGRDPANVLQLHDTEVSRRHAELRPGPNGMHVVTDLGSSNGTYVNGQRVKTRALVSGDELQLGRSMMLYTGSGSEPSGDLADKIDIIARNQPEDRSRIVRAMSQEEGSQLLELDIEGSPSPWLARARSNLQVMYRTALAVSHTLDIDQLLDRIMQLIFEWVEADRGCIMLVDATTKKLEPKVRRTRKGVRGEEKMQISKTILDYVLEHNEGVLTSDARKDDRWNPAASIVQQGINEAICAPMRGRYDVVGVIYIDTSTSPQRVIQGAGPKFSEEHLKLMIAIAHQAALAVEDTRYYSAMVQAERLAAMGQTIATLSHHIKNILQGIRGGSFLIKEGLAQHDESMVGKGWEFVERNQERISTLVMDMLTFSKEREPELMPGQLNDVVGEVIELMQSRAAEKSVELLWGPAGDMPQLTFDPEGMHRAVLNVVSNAIDACDHSRGVATNEDDDDDLTGDQTRPLNEVVRAAPRVEVRTEINRAENQARVYVRDNGVGISAEARESIFSLFISHKGGRGTGLGLPVSQKILQEHGGRIVVESELGQGSCFILELPAVYPDAAKQTMTMPIPTP